MRVCRYLCVCVCVCVNVCVCVHRARTTNSRALWHDVFICWPHTPGLFFSFLCLQGAGHEFNEIITWPFHPLTICVLALFFFLPLGFGPRIQRHCVAPDARLRQQLRRCVAACSCCNVCCCSVLLVCVAVCVAVCSCCNVCCCSVVL